MNTSAFVYEHFSGGGWREQRGRYGPTAAAELLAQGRAMRDAIVADLVLAADCSVSAAVCEAGNTLPPPAIALRPQPGESAFDFVARHSAQHDLVWLVAPETGGLLAQLQRAVPPGRSLGCSADAIALASSKQATLAHLARHGVLTPLAFVQAPQTRRWVVKPDDGAGAVDTLVHARHDDALFDLAGRARAGASATLEPWVDGEALSLSLLCTAQAAEMLSINRQCIVVDAQGRVQYEGVRIDALQGTSAVRQRDVRWRPLAALATQVAHAIPGLRGFVGIDLVWHATRGPVVIEVNPRVTCAYAGLSAALGRNLAGELVAAHGLRGRLHGHESAHANA
jgi:predicted ATP-grasp superfamily ATP-dependent carboligase